MFSILLPLKLDDDADVDEDERYTWNQVFLPIWIAYATSTVLVIVCGIRSMPEYPQCTGCKSCLCGEGTLAILPVCCFGLIPMISILLIQLKLTDSELDISWVEALSPMFVEIPLFCMCFCFSSFVCLAVSDED